MIDRIDYNYQRLSYTKGKTVKLTGIELHHSPVLKQKIIISDDVNQEIIGEIEYFQLKTLDAREVINILLANARTNTEQMDELFAEMMNSVNNLEDCTLPNNYFNSIFISEVYLRADYRKLGICAVTMEHLKEILNGLGIYTEKIMILCREFDEDREYRGGISDKIIHLSKKINLGKSQYKNGIYVTEE